MKKSLIFVLIGTFIIATAAIYFFLRTSPDPVKKSRIISKYLKPPYYESRIKDFATRTWDTRYIADTTYYFIVENNKTVRVDKWEYDYYNPGDSVTVLEPKEYREYQDRQNRQENREE